MVVFVRSIIVFVIFLGSVVAADNPSVTEAQTQQLTVYAGAFVYPDPAYDSLVLVEFPFSLNRNEFEFYHPFDTDSNLYARIFAQVNLIDTYGETVDSASTFFSVRVPSKREAMRKGIRLFNKIILMVKPGLYSARLTVIDAANKNSGRAFIDKVIVEPSQAGHITIGGPELAYRVTPVTDSVQANARLVKNGFKIIPNPISIFSADSDSMIYVYGELYNLVLDKGKSDKAQLSFVVLRDDNVFEWLGKRTITKPDSNAVFTESFSIKNWPSGLYQLMVAVKDMANGSVDTNTVLFRILSKADILATVRENRQKHDPYNTLSVTEQSQLVSYFLTPQQKATLNRLSQKGKQNYLEEYWKEHNYKINKGDKPDRTTLVKRFLDANRLFSTNDTKDNGWATDRGRIYMTYGPWEEIENREVPRLRNAYEIWYYHSVKEGKYFVFEVWRDANEYRLVHSNVYGEIFSKEWDRIIRSGIIDIEPDQLPETSAP